MKKNNTKPIGAMISVEAAAAVLGCSGQFILGLIQNGKLTAHSVSSNGRTHQVIVRKSLDALPARDRKAAKSKR